MLLPGPPSTPNSNTAEHKYNSIPFIIMHPTFTSTQGYSRYSLYRLGLRLDFSIEFGVLFHAQDILETARFCTVTTDPPAHCTTTMQNRYRHFNTLYTGFNNYFSFWVGSAFAEAQYILQDVLLHIYLICRKPAYNFVLNSARYSAMVSAWVLWLCLNNWDPGITSAVCTNFFRPLFPFSSYRKGVFFIILF